MRIAIHKPPQNSTAEADRDAECGEMVDAAMDEIAAAAVAEGWHRGEILAAVLDWTVNTARDHAPDAAVRELLHQAIAMLDQRTP